MDVCITLAVHVRAPSIDEAVRFATSGIDARLKAELVGASEVKEDEAHG